VPRLFVAIDFPQKLKLSLAKLCFGVPEARWVRYGNFHLTLRFIGQVDDALAAEIDRVLARVKAAAFTLTLAGVGHFGFHTLWVGVACTPLLMSLHAAIENELLQIGLPADPRPFSPHVKLARLKRRTGLRGILAGNAGFRAEPFEVREFSLIESTPGANGAVYRRRADYPLDREAPLAIGREGTWRATV